jgi:acyl-CoA thioesterase-1
MCAPRLLATWGLAVLLSGCARAPSAESSELSGESLAQPARDAAASAERPAIPSDAPLVLFLGDSISAGLHLDPSQAFPAVLQRLLAAEGAPFRLVNAGVSGDTSAGGLRRLETCLKQSPDVLVLELGGNDGLRGQPVAEIETRLRTIIERSQAAGVRVLLLGVRLPPSLGRDYVHEFESLYPRLAEALDCAFVPFFMEGAAGDPTRMLDDGIHPNAAGHERLAANVARALREIVTAVTAR